MARAKGGFVILVVPVLVSCLLGVTSCNKPPFMGGVPVESVTLKSSLVEQSGIYQAKLISRHSVSLQPQVDGQIAAIYVKAGDRVSGGQLLMLIDKRKQEAALNSNKADAAAAKAMLNNYQIQRKALQSAHELNKKLFDRYTALYTKHSVSKQDLEKYTDSLNKAEADLEANAAQIETQKAEIEKSLYSIKEQEAQLQYYKITAPYSGIVGDIPVKAGNFVTQSTQLLSITQNEKLEVNVGLSVEKVFDIHEGLPVEVLDNNSKVVASSNISFISPSVDTDTQTVLVKSIINNAKGILKADQSVKVRVVYNKAQGIMVPTSAISHLAGQDFAFSLIKKGEKFFVKQLPIKLGEIQGDKYVVLGGLQEGDQIVAKGIQKLMDGAPVTVITTDLSKQQKGMK